MLKQIMVALSAVPPAVWFGFCGAVALKLLELAELAKVPKASRPDLKDPVYWVPFAVMPILGGGLVFAYVASSVEMKPMLAVNVGVSAPLILRAMAQANPMQGAAIKVPKGA
jgi:hypothetical protein